MNVFDNEAFEASGMSIAELAKAARVAPAAWAASLSEGDA